MAEPKKPRFDRNSPQAKALIDEIVHGTFIKEGTIVAFPTCFPGASSPIPADESRITALDITPEGIIYGATSGRAAHVFVAMFQGVTGMVFDRGIVLGANQSVAVCCGKNKFVVCANGPEGGRLISGTLQALPFDLIQDWGFSRPPLQQVDQFNREPIVHAITDDSGSLLVGITSSHLFTFPLEGGKIDILHEVPGRGRIALGDKGGVFGQDTADRLWRFDPVSGKIERGLVSLPPGTWQAPIRWARNQQSGLLYTADDKGNLFSFDEQRGFSSPLAQTLLAPVGPCAVTHDGRLFGFCGDEMAKLFCYHPGRQQLTNLGVAVSVLERRRYGYSFGDAVTGRDGQIVFGEDDDLGHLWLYFPSIQKA